MVSRPTEVPLASGVNLREPSASMPILDSISNFHDDLIAWRRHLHQNPELGYDLFETSKFVVEKLSGFGLDEIHTGLGRTGVVAVLRAGTSPRSIGLRADMDALPIEELTGKPWTSKNQGKMHACGHDGHTTMLLGAARQLAATRNFDGTVYFIFQPAEEGEAGAAAMIKDGLFERFPAERVFGLHNIPDFAPGQFAICEGPIMAATAEFTLRVRGRGCHAAMAFQGNDTILSAALLVTALQGIVSRSVKPVDTAVLSITRIAGGDAYNVLPAEVELWGTVRTYQREVQDLVEQRMRAICAGIASAQGVTIELDFQSNYPATINTPAEARMGADAARAIVGADQVIWNMPPSMGAEDFAYMLQAKPGSYIWLGVGGAELGQVCHSPTYDFNDDMLPMGATYWVTLAERLLG
jgi:amidohydrolase